MNLNQNASTDLEKRWYDVLYNLTEYSSIAIESIYKDLDPDFISQLPSLDEDFIQLLFQKNCNNMFLCFHIIDLLI